MYHSFLINFGLLAPAVHSDFVCFMVIKCVSCNCPPTLYTCYLSSFILL